ncbi:oxidoreductase [Gryllotalpicola protaetiae]|uniref:Oxidoreductase n=2 Tax=Gryllotalpicola protaetiae TaxID=2419771 RepID=A0A387BU63_9MICO|nr:oxidoreductase [Gryllotalpicola protaetiae]
MQALRLISPALDASQVRVGDVPVPIAGEGEVLIEVAFAGLNFSDVMARRGDPGYAASYPFIPGLEIAGIVREVADGAQLAPGDRVAAFVPGGGLAELAVASAALTVRVPPEVPLDLAATAPLMLSTAILLLEDVGRIRPGESLLMHSAGGGLGSSVSQVAAFLHAGVKVGTVGREDKIAAARNAGWDHVVVRDGNWPLKVQQLLPDGVELVLDPTGTDNLDHDARLVAAGGRMVLFGNPGGGDLSPLPGLRTLMAGNIGILGFSIRRLSADKPTRVAAALARALDLLASGAIRPEVTVIDGLVNVAAVHNLLASGRGVGKYVAAVTPE